LKQDLSKSKKETGNQLMTTTVMHQQRQHSKDGTARIARWQRVKPNDVHQETLTTVHYKAKPRPTIPSNANNLSNEQLVTKAKQGHEWAKEILIEKNRPFISKIAFHYAKRSRIMSMDDLMAQGNLGILHAIDKYDPHHEKDTAFFTYATWWIRAFIYNHLCNFDKTIRIPLKVITEQHRLSKGKFQGSDRQEEFVEHTILLGQIVSLDAPLNGSTGRGNGSFENLSLGDMIASDQRQIDDTLVEKQKVKRILDAVDRLNPPASKLELAILYDRIMGNSILETIAIKFGISRERVRQVERSFILRVQGKVKRDVKI
jgi:RNA polymerase sigma factor (sigma-70 family)